MVFTCCVLGVVLVGLGCFADCDGVCFCLLLMVSLVWLFVWFNSVVCFDIWFFVFKYLFIVILLMFGFVVFCLGLICYERLFAIIYYRYVVGLWYLVV